MNKKNIFNNNTKTEHYDTFVIKNKGVNCTTSTDTASKWGGCKHITCRAFSDEKYWFSDWFRMIKKRYDFVAFTID